MRRPCPTTWLPPWSPAHTHLSPAPTHQRPPAQTLVILVLPRASGLQGTWPTCEWVTAPSQHPRASTEAQPTSALTHLDWCYLQQPHTCSGVRTCLSPRCLSISLFLCVLSVYVSPSECSLAHGQLKRHESRHNSHTYTHVCTHIETHTHMHSCGIFILFTAPLTAPSLCSEP